MSIDITPVDPKTTPAIEAKEYPLSYMRKLITEASSPTCVRLYAEFCPYRRISDADGNVIGAEFKSPEVDGDITVIEIGNIIPTTDTDADGEALVAQTIGQFLAQGGNVGALAFSALLLAVRQIGIQQGKFTA